MGNLTLVFILFHLPTISKTAVLVSGSSLYKEAIFKSISAALGGSDGFTWSKQNRFFLKKKGLYSKTKMKKIQLLPGAAAVSSSPPAGGAFPERGC